MPTKVQVKKTKKSTQRPVKKTVKKTARKVTWNDGEAGLKELKKIQKETWLAIRENQRKIDGLNSVVDRILTPGLPQKFKKFGYSFTRLASYSYTAGVWAQIDGMLENGTQAMAVEVKMTLRQSDIDDHILRMEKIRKFADEHGDNRQFIGAIAAIITDEPTKNYALEKGLFVIEPSGEDVKVTKPAVEPRVW